MKLYTILKLDEYFIRNHIIIIIIKRLNSNEYKKEDDGIITNSQSITEGWHC